MFKRLKTVFKHRWMDESDTRSAIAPDVLKRLAGRVAASERRHSGEIRIYVEASLPMSYLWRHLRLNTSMQILTRERAVSMFGKLHVWDTQHNNGVLIYLLLAERQIEVVADRGINAVVDTGEWQAMIHRMGLAFRDGRFEDGLTQALEEVSAPLAKHFAVQEGDANVNELPDLPQLG